MEESKKSQILPRLKQFELKPAKNKKQPILQYQGYEIKWRAMCEFDDQFLIGIEGEVKVNIQN